MRLITAHRILIGAGIAFFVFYAAWQGRLWTAGGGAVALVQALVSAAVALANLDIMERERLWERAAKLGERLHAGLRAALGDHPHVGDIRGGKGLLAAVELVEDRGTKANFPADRKLAARLQAEMVKRGMVTRTRPVVGPHPAPGDCVFFAPPLVVSEAEVDRIVAITHDALRAVLGA